MKTAQDLKVHGISEAGFSAMDARSALQLASSVDPFVERTIDGFDGTSKRKKRRRSLPNGTDLNEASTSTNEAFLSVSHFKEEPGVDLENCCDPNNQTANDSDFNNTYDERYPTDYGMDYDEHATSYSQVNAKCCVRRPSLVSKWTLFIFKQVKAKLAQ